MANPNIANAATITGITTLVSIGATNTFQTLLSNANGSGKIYKLNTILAVNDDGGNSADVNIRYNMEAAGAGTSFALAHTVVIPAQSSVTVIGKDNPIYVTENNSITVSASAANDIDVVCSFDEFS
tara:strand:- start:3622 stop:3999 length:378 start_codon:yes stop_codon:yes gene_type:complete